MRDVRLCGIQAYLVRSDFLRLHKLAIGDTGRLFLSANRYQHIVNRHTLDGSKFTAGRTSYFNRNVDVKSLIENASEQPGKLNGSGFYERVINADKNIGVDRATGRQTTTYTVISDKKGNVITSHPGQPGKPRQR